MFPRRSRASLAAFEQDDRGVVVPAGAAGGVVRILEQPLVRTGPPRLRVEGDIGGLPLARFNALLLPANGLEITGGTLEHATFRFDVASGRSVGELRAQWRGLDLRLVDPVTGRQSFGRKLKSVGARMLSRNDNLPDEHGRLPAVPIRYEIQPEDTFWGLIWRSLRSGLVLAVRS